MEYLDLEFFSVVFYFIVIFILPIVNIIRFFDSMIYNKIKNKNDLENYDNAKKKTYKIFKVTMISLYLSEIFMFIYNYNGRCMDGICDFKVIPQIICIIIQIILYIIFRIFIKNENKKSEKSVKTLYLVMCIILTIVSFAIVLILSKNDVAALHKVLM
jgi:uncharacterized membrane protein